MFSIVLPGKGEILRVTDEVTEDEYTFICK